jgi:hypothetical protein
MGLPIIYLPTHVERQAATGSAFNDEQAMPCIGSGT